MLRGIVVAAVVAASGCAAHRVPASIAPPISTPTDWSAVQALPRGTAVDVTIGGGDPRPGLVLTVSDETLRLREKTGDHDLARDDIARVAAWVQTGMTRDPWYVRIPLESAILGGLAGVVTGAVTKNKTTQRISWAAFIGGLFTSVGYGDAHPPHAIYETRLVYLGPAGRLAAK
jgi:hypothetical protein